LEGLERTLRKKQVEEKVPFSMSEGENSGRTKTTRDTPKKGKQSKKGGERKDPKKRQHTTAIVRLDA